MEELFKTVGARDDILDFIKETHFITSYDFVNFFIVAVHLDLILLLTLFVICVNHLFISATHDF